MDLNEKIAERRRELAAEAEKAKNAEEAREAERRKELLAVENEKYKQRQQEADDILNKATSDQSSPKIEPKYHWTEEAISKYYINKNYIIGVYKTISPTWLVIAQISIVFVTFIFVTEAIHQFTKQKPLTPNIINQWTLVYQNKSVGNAYADYTSIKKTVSGTFIFDVAFNKDIIADIISNDSYEVNCTNMDLKYLGSELSVDDGVHKNTASYLSLYPIDLIDTVVNEVCRRATGKHSATYSNRSANSSSFP